MIEVSRTARFSAGHRYYLGDLSPEENLRLFGLCARPHGHGHDYRLTVTHRGFVDPATGMVINITALKELLQAEVIEPLDGRMLLPGDPFLEGWIPTTEALSLLLFRRLDAAAAGRNLPGRICRVRLEESRRLWSTCSRTEEGEVVELTRTYEFSAAHRLHSEGLSELENRELYGKCNNPSGHGHNYIVEVTVGGEIDPRTGLLVDLGWLDGLAEQEVVQRYDHRHLNLDLPEFAGLNPTSENVAQQIFDRLEARMRPGLLRRVTLHETARNSFTCDSGSGAKVNADE